MTSVLLSEHVYPCLSGTQVVLLDLLNDDYEMVDAQEASPLAQLIPGWPVPDPAPPLKPIGMDDPGLAYMLEKKWITTNPAEGKAATPIQLQRPNDSLFLTPVVFEDEQPARMPLRIRDIAAFLFATMRARISLRFFPLKHTAMVVSRRRVRKSRSAKPYDRAKAQQLVDLYQRLRSCLFTSHNECFRDSLTFVHFAAWYDIYPSWVFGVQTSPFAAHCWVQDQDLLFNDEVENVGPYTPIMAL